MSRPAVRVRNRARHKMKASVRHGIHGKPQVCQKRGRAATQSHHTDPFEKRCPSGDRLVASTRHDDVPTRGPGVPARRRELRYRSQTTTETRTGIYCNRCNRRLATTDEPHEVEYRPCYGHGVVKSYEVEVKATRR